MSHQDEKCFTIFTQTHRFNLLGYYS